MTISRRGALTGLAGIAAHVSSSTLYSRPNHAQPNPLKVGQIGVGHAHANKLSVYLASADYQVLGIAEPDPLLRKQAQQTAPFKDVPWMEVEQLLNIPDLDVVLVETRVKDLLPTAQACIDAGKHVHLDKPAGDSLPAYERLLREAKQKKLLVQMGYMYRFNPAILLLHEFLRQGWLGDIFEIHAVMSKVVDPSSRQQLAQFSGGMMFELGCHLIDLVVGVLGPPDKVTPFRRHSSAIEDRLQDNMLAVFEYPRALATVKTTALEVEGFSRRHFVVCGTEGSFHIQPLDQPTARVALSQPRGDFPAGYQEEILFGRFERYHADAADMVRLIRGEKDAENFYTHDLAVQTAVHQACGLSL